MVKQKKQNGIDVLKHYFKAFFRFYFDDLTPTGLFFAVTIRIAIALFVILEIADRVSPNTYTSQEYEQTISDLQMKANLYESVAEANRQLSQGGPEGFVFISQWIQKDQNSYFNGDGSVQLKNNQTSSVFEYDGDVPPRSDYNMNVVSRGVNGANAVVIRPGLYEITLGDNNPSIVTLKAVQKLGGAMEDVPVLNWEKFADGSNLERPRSLNCGFEYGEEVKVEVIESYSENTQSYLLDLVTTCNNGKAETFSWSFTPQPRWHEVQELQIGVLDNASSSNATRVDFLGLVFEEMKQ